MHFFDYKYALNHLKQTVDLGRYLEARGIKVHYQNGGQRLNFSLRDDDKTPSCFAHYNHNENRWLWKDFGDERLKGSVIDLCKYLENVNSISEVVKILNQYSSAPISGIEDVKLKPIKISQSSKQESKVGDYTKNPTIKHLVPLNDTQKRKILYSYAYGRGIDIDILKSSIVESLKESSDNSDKEFYYLGMPIINHLNENIIGYTLRNKYAKLFANASGISVDYQNKSNAKSSVIVVEGMFDYLSLLQLQKEYCMKLNANYLILNSVVNTSKAIDNIYLNYMREHQVLLLLDNDKYGQQASDNIEAGLRTKNFTNVHNLSKELFHNTDIKDLNNLFNLDKTEHIKAKHSVIKRVYDCVKSTEVKSQIKIR